MDCSGLFWIALEGFGLLWKSLDCSGRFWIDLVSTLPFEILFPDDDTRRKDGSLDKRTPPDLIHGILVMADISVMADLLGMAVLVMATLLVAKRR